MQVLELLQAERVKIKASQILRQINVKQHKGGWTDGQGAFCARGAIMHYFGWNGRMFRNGRMFSDDGKCDNFDHYIQKENELYPLQIRDDVVMLNDNLGMPFEDIADFLEEQGY